MELRHYPAFPEQRGNIGRGGNDFAAGVTEQHRLNIIPAAGQRVHAEAFPQPGEELAGIVPFAEIHQDDFGAAGDIPASEAAFQLFIHQRVSQGVPAGLVCFHESRVILQIRADQIILVPKRFHCLQCLAGQNLVYAADLVAYFPADLKQAHAFVVH